jgi:hypothetical protein
VETGSSGIHSSRPRNNLDLTLDSPSSSPPRPIRYSTISPQHFNHPHQTPASSPEDPDETLALSVNDDSRRIHRHAYTCRTYRSLSNRP